MADAENIKRVLDLIVCPHCRGSLSFTGNESGDGAAITCTACQRHYSIKDGIPVLTSTSDRAIS